MIISTKAILFITLPMFSVISGIRKSEDMRFAPVSFLTLFISGAKILAFQ